MDEYKSKVSEETRIQECSRILNKHPDRIPIIVCKDKRSTTLQDIDKHKYLVPKDMHLSQFIYVIRKRIKLKPEQTIFVTVNNELCSNNSTLEEIYNTYKNKDGFLYIEYSSENTFG